VTVLDFQRTLISTAPLFFEAFLLTSVLQPFDAPCRTSKATVTGMHEYLWQRQQQVPTDVCDHFPAFL
jgi:hypothetical protein